MVVPFSLFSVVRCIRSFDCEWTAGGLGWKISEKEFGVGLKENSFGFGVVFLEDCLGNLRIFFLLGKGVTFKTLLSKLSIRLSDRSFTFGLLPSLLNMSLNVDLSTLFPNPPGVLGPENN